MEKSKEDFIRQLLLQDAMLPADNRRSNRQIASAVSEEFGTSPDSASVRRKISKIRSKEFSSLDGFLEEKGIDKNKVSVVWHKSNGDKIDYSVMTDERTLITQENIEEVFAHLTSSYSPTLLSKKDVKGIRKQVENGKHLLVIDPADLHFGKLGADYSLDIAKKRLKEGVEGIVAKASGYPIEKCVLVIGNDYLHAEGYTNKTTKGTPQDVDGMWDNVFNVALRSYVEVIDYISQFWNVHVIYNPSNHDYVIGYGLAKAIEAWFQASELVTFDCNLKQRKYYSYGSNLICTTHGDKEKWGDLPILMAHEAPTEWATTKHRYVYTHHVHHMTLTKGMFGKDYIGVTVQSLRSPSSADRWHEESGYVGAPKAVEGAIHHFDHGRLAVLTHIF